VWARVALDRYNFYFCRNIPMLDIGVNLIVR